jgi:hypothetical protein
MSANRMKPLKDDEVKGYIRKVDLSLNLPSQLLITVKLGLLLVMILPEEIHPVPN